MIIDESGVIGTGHAGREATLAAARPMVKALATEGREKPTKVRPGTLGGILQAGLSLLMVDLKAFRAGQVRTDDAQGGGR